MPAREEHPTLYMLSNIAFPLRWIDRSDFRFSSLGDAQ
jgi:hypothetical protein